MVGWDLLFYCLFYCFFFVAAFVIHKMTNIFTGSRSKESAGPNNTRA